MYINTILVIIPIIVGLLMAGAITQTDNEDPAIVVGGILWGVVLMMPLLYTAMIFTGVE